MPEVLSTDPTCTPVTVRGSDGVQLTACAHGGHLLSWRSAGTVAREALWLSPAAVCGPGEAIRGGVPVIFPQFAARGPLPKHGLARDRAWSLDPLVPAESGSAGPAQVLATLTDDEDTRAIWPQRFTLTLRMAAAADRLSLTLAVRNDGARPLTFTAALHTYLAADPGSTVHGLDGATAEDNAASGSPVVLPTGPLDALGERDLAVRNHPGPVRLELADGGSVTLGRNGFDDLVIWNPGAGHTLGDVPPGLAHFVCLEPAQLTAVPVEPGQGWQAEAVMTVHQATTVNGERP